MLAVACPYFFPTEKSANISWPFPRRLPLGGGFCGSCMAGGTHIPDEQELREFCNIGYARECRRIPAERPSDAIRFAVARDNGDRILLHYSSERDHAPVDHGLLQYNCAARTWPVPHPDACIQRQAECYVSLYLDRRK